MLRNYSPHDELLHNVAVLTKLRSGTGADHIGADA